MTPSVERYCQIKNDIISKSPYINSSELNKLILDFAKEINSVRRCGAIKSLEELISVLEKRDFVSAQNIKPLMFILVRVCDPSVNRLSNIQNEEIASNLLQYDNYGRSNSSRSATISEDIRSRTLSHTVVKLVSEEIGKKWRDLARQLGLREGDVNQIETRFPGDLKERAYACLIKFQENNTEGVEQKLLNALEKARRNDLRKQVEAILRPY